MDVPKNLNDLKILVENVTDESLFLEFKAKDALDFNKEENKKKFSKTISSFANSAGGVVIYGIKEDKSNSNKVIYTLDPITGQITKEQLEQIIHSSISPKIDGLQVYPIESLDPNGIIFFIEIPQSTTVHQNTKDKVYYKRHNFSSTPMEDYEIRDVMNRAKHPDIEVEFEILKQVTLKTEKKEKKIYHNPGEPILSFQKLLSKEYEEIDITITEYFLEIYLANKGNLLANYVFFEVDISIELLHETEFATKEIQSDNTVIITGKNTIRDLIDSKYDGFINKSVYGPSRYDPILPMVIHHIKSIRLKEINKNQFSLNWRVNADNALNKSGSILFNEIKITEKHLDKRKKRF